MEVIAENIPEELKALPQWVTHRGKKPINPISDQYAKASQPDTWVDFQKAYYYYQNFFLNGEYDGIGFEFADDGGLVGIDFDHCLLDGKLDPWVEGWVNRLNSYTEVSPSGTGLHVFCYGKLPGRSVKRKEAELYDRGRYFTVTGNVYGQGRGLRDAQDAINELYGELTEKKKPAPEKPTVVCVGNPDDDDQLLQKARAAANGEKFHKLYDLGDYSDHPKLDGTPDHSAGDLALCNLLAFWTGRDAARMDRLFRQSAMMRDKWDEKHGERTYGEMTIDNAVEQNENVYTPRPTAAQDFQQPYITFAPSIESVAAKVDEILQANPDTLGELLPAALLDMLSRMEDEVAQEKEISRLRTVARKKGFVREMDRILKLQRSKYPPAIKKQIDGTDVIDLPGIPLQGLTIPGNWSVDEKTGIAWATEDDYKFACPHPVIITERLQNIDTRAEKLNIAFLRDHRWTSVPVKRSITASRTSIVSLADMGIQVTSETAKELVRFLFELESYNKDIIPRKKSISRAGWVGTDTFFPYSGDYTFDGEEEFRDMYEALTEVGSASEWLTLIEQEREKSPCLRAMLAASFSAPLLWLLGLLCFCVHGWGISGTGKTVALYGAMSIWGNPLALIRSFNATELGLEKCAAFCHSIPLALDERETAKNDRYAAFDQLIYRLTEGHGRAKSNRNSGLQRIDKWQLPILTTGESPLIADNSKGGAQNRVIELYCDTPLLTDAPAAAEVFKTCYGGVGKQWIKILLDIAQNPERMEWLKKRYQLFKSYLQESGQYNDKPLASVAVMMLADYLSSFYFFKLDEKQAAEEAFQLGRTIINGLQTRREADEANRAWEFICGWAASNKNHFNPFYDPCFGIMDEKGVFIIASVFNQAMTEAGFNPRSCAKAWGDRELITKPKTVKELQIVRRINGVCARGYQLKIDINEKAATDITDRYLEELENRNPANPLQ